MTNYVANAAEDCKLVGAVSISGCNEVAALHFDSYSQRVWQPVVCLDRFKELRMLTCQGPSKKKRV